MWGGWAETTLLAFITKEWQDRGREGCCCSRPETQDACGARGVVGASPGRAWPARVNGSLDTHILRLAARMEAQWITCSWAAPRQRQNFPRYGCCCPTSSWPTDLQGTFCTPKLCCQPEAGEAVGEDPTQQGSNAQARVQTYFCFPTGRETCQVSSLIHRGRIATTPSLTFSPRSGPGRSRFLRSPGLADPPQPKTRL